MTTRSDDVAWRCWRYLLGELEEGEAAAFEDRVASDEDIAVALADAARLHQAIAVGRPAVATTRPRPASRRRVAACAVAATLVAVLCGLPAVRWMGGATPPATDLVALWSAADPAPLSGDEMPDDVDDPAVDDVPAWLVAAVSIRPSVPAQEP